MAPRQPALHWQGEGHRAARLWKSFLKHYRVGQLKSNRQAPYL